MRKKSMREEIRAAKNSDDQNKNVAIIDLHK